MQISGGIKMYVKCVVCGEKVKSGKAVLEYDELKETTVPYCHHCHQIREMKKERCKGGM